MSISQTMTPEAWTGDEGEQAREEMDSVWKSKGVLLEGGD